MARFKTLSLAEAVAAFLAENGIQYLFGIGGRVLIAQAPAAGRGPRKRGDPFEQIVEFQRATGIGVEIDLGGHD